MHTASWLCGGRVWLGLAGLDGSRTAAFTVGRHLCAFGTRFGSMAGLSLMLMLLGQGGREAQHTLTLPSIVLLPWKTTSGGESQLLMICTSVRGQHGYACTLHAHSQLSHQIEGYAWIPSHGHAYHALMMTPTDVCACPCYTGKCCCLLLRAAPTCVPLVQYLT